MELLDVLRRATTELNRQRRGANASTRDAPYMGRPLGVISVNHFAERICHVGNVRRSQCMCELRTVIIKDHGR